MEEPLGDILFKVLSIILVSTFIGGWLILLLMTALQYLFPKSQDKLEMLLQKSAKPIEVVQKYSFYGVLILFVLRLVVGWLGWAPPLFGTGEE